MQASVCNPFAAQDAACVLHEMHYLMHYTGRLSTLATEIITTKQLCAEYGIPEATLRWWRHTDQGPASFKLGMKRVVYRRGEVEKWVASREIATTRGGVG
ncbi:helix-turn-helix transcriptional regulator [Rhodococcus sp. NyZ502]|uniref:helix-turn-helix transcriptional regulator n=1 Tax=Rhodococcus sp. NyZ502 TaxID=3242855 RepID=UPI003557A383